MASAEERCFLGAFFSKSEPVDGMNNNGDFSNEIIITNIYEDSDEQRADVAYAVLSTVFPPVEREDIKSIRLLRSGKQEKEGSTASGLDNRRPSWIIRFSRRNLVENMMRAKNKITAFSTKHVDVSSLNQETCNSLLHSKTFINELLSKECLYVLTI